MPSSVVRSRPWTLRSTPACTRTRATASSAASAAAMPAEEPLVRHAVTVPAHEAERTLALLLDVFPDGLEQEDLGDTVVLAGYLPAGREPRLPAGLDARA